MFSLYLPIAEMSVNIASIFFISFFIGILSILLGISGGFILSPFLISLGIPSSVIVGSTGIQSFTTSFNAFFRYLKQGDIPFKMATIITISGLLGVIIGVNVFKYISFYYNVNLFVAYGFITLLISVFFLTYFSERKREHSQETQSEPLQNNQDNTSLLLIGLTTGIIASFLGIGGGLLIVPLLKFFYKLKDKTAICLSQTNIVFTSLLSLLMHATLNNNFDPFLSLLLLISGLIGSQIGLIIYEKFPRKLAYYLFCTVILVTLSTLIYSILSNNLSDVYRNKSIVYQKTHNEIIVNHKEYAEKPTEKLDAETPNLTSTVKSYSINNPSLIVTVIIGIAISLSMVLNWTAGKRK